MRSSRLSRSGFFRCLLRRGAASAVASALGLAAVAEAGPSGLPWQSGAACTFDEFAAWRGRPLDVHLLFTGHTTWAEMLQVYRGGYLDRFTAAPGKVVISMPLIAREADTPSKFSQCYRGKFDRHFREAARLIVGKGLGDSYIRLGWEANISSRAWYVGADIDGYKRCWRRIAVLLKSIAPSFKLEWTVARGGNQSFDMRRAWPGGDVVDVVGFHNYDRYPSYNGQAAWDKAYLSTSRYGEPQGVGGWLAFARSKGKKLSISEWAVSDGYKDSGSTDNAFFIQKMYEFFRGNAASIEYESYFNCLGGLPAGVYRVYPTQDNPLAAARYQALWRAEP